MAETNPYRPPPPEGEPDEPETSSTEGTPEQPKPLRVFYAAWTVVVALNCIMPFLFATSTVNRSGFLGIGLGILTFVIAGAWVGTLGPNLRKGMVSGGLIVALTQFMPIAQLLAGICAIEVIRFLGLEAEVTGAPFPIMGPVGAYLCTILTGGALIVLTSIFGGIFVMFARLWAVHRGEGTDTSGSIVGQRRSG
ncbi:MAG: hypothetical protein AAFV88_15925 [Planctomycetota bacterium]